MPSRLPPLDVEPTARHASEPAPASDIITPHLRLAEFACHDGTPYPPAWIHDRLYPLCLALETIRAACGGHSMRVLSGFRTEAHNRSVGGSPYSQHLLGMAADVAVVGVEAREVYAAALRLYGEGRLRVGGLGLYARQGFVHVDVRHAIKLATWGA